MNWRGIHFCTRRAYLYNLYANSKSLSRLPPNAYGRQYVLVSPPSSSSAPSSLSSFSSSPTSQYIPQQYYPSPVLQNSLHTVPPPSRSELAQRKRPKYTRSKTGCLTCRVKKIKVLSLSLSTPSPSRCLTSLCHSQCDETKPNCMRCTHGSREVFPALFLSSSSPFSTLLVLLARRRPRS